MVQKLAIAISGAVSLGSYEAGVLYETIEAIAQHNRHKDTTEDERIEIDVITGASAGAMSACILVQKLLFDADALRRGPEDNDLYNAWVKDVDIKEFLEIKKGDDPLKSLLSSMKVKKIGERYLTSRYNAETVKPPIPHPAISKKNEDDEEPKDNEIWLGIAMSNLNGFDFVKESTDYRQFNGDKDNSYGSGSLRYTQHQDCFTIKVNSDSDNKEFWEKIEKVGRSSGAFPFAFRVVDIERDRDEEIYKNAIFPPTQKAKFTYTDGSVFENEPLGMAKFLVNKIDKEPRAYENRFYLYVAPGLQESRNSKENEDCDKKEKKEKFSEENANYFNTALSLAKAIFNQARFQDWIRAEEINQSIRRFDEQAVNLKDFLEKRENLDLQKKLDEVFSELLKELYKTDDNTNSSKQTDTQTEDLKRLEEQFQEERSKFKDTNLASTWMKIVQVLEKSAKLGDRDIMKIYAITSTEEELIGEQLNSFIGFFDERFRCHDYQIGRKNAIESLRKIKSHNESCNSKNGSGDKDCNQRKEICIKNFELSPIPQIPEEFISIAKGLPVGTSSKNIECQGQHNQAKDQDKNDPDPLKVALQEVNEEKLPLIAEKFANILSQLIYILIFDYDGKSKDSSSYPSNNNENSSNSPNQLWEIQPFKFIKKYSLRLAEVIISFVVSKFVKKLLKRLLSS